MAQRTVKVGLVGFGTVGCGVVKLITEQADLMAQKTGIRLELGCVVDIDTKKQRPVKLEDGLLTDDINKMLSDKSIEIGVELVGGTSIAKQIQLQMLNSGKDVVTANKALLAEHGSELMECARKNNRCIAFEASCAGGIPIISAMRTGLTANDITAIYGIVNGTCNYILSSMTEKSESFANALSQAQQKGFAEADPTLDINGTDSAHKLAILASIAFGCKISMDDIFVEGIEQISLEDIRYGGEMGYTLKLLAIGEKNDDNKILLRVHPSFIARENPLAGVSGSFNAVSIFGNAAGQLMFYGRGAGMMPTASAVVADIIDVATGNSANSFQHTTRPATSTDCTIEQIGNQISRFYIRLMAKDQVGVFTQIGSTLAENDISISGVLQHEGCGPNETVPVVITTHPTLGNRVSSALKGLAELETICGKPVCIRIVDIPEDKD